MHHIPGNRNVDRIEYVRWTDERVQHARTHDASYIMQIRHRDVDEKMTET